MNVRTIVLSIFLAIGYTTYAQEKTETTTETTTPVKKWYETINLRGYMQVRHNNLVMSNDKLGCAQCDNGWGGNGGVSLKRARIVLSGQVYKNVFFKFETDVATGISPAGPASQNFAQVRDAYFDIGLDEENEFWVRIGQSKVPYGFEILQSSQTRSTLDRSDAINSASLTERDLGAMFYWAPKEIRQLYRELANPIYKGSGDYGVIGIGVVNGQTANRPEMNKKQHIFARASYPLKIGDQIIEPGIQAYSGKYVMYDSQLTPGVITNTDKNYTDRRAGASFVLYPKPLGFQVEYNIGEGPEFDKATQSIRVQSLQGGYALVNYRLPYKNQYFFPYARYQYYSGGKKFETDARSYTVHQVDFGVEWQMNKHFELTAEYVFADRRYEDFALQTNHQTGNNLRVQAQVNF